MKIIREGVFSILYIIVLIVLLVIPLGNTHIEQIDVVGFRGDYIIHCLVYIPWMFIGWILFPTKFNALLWFVAGVAFVTIMELVQYIIPYRSYNINDLIAGEIGVLLSLVIFSIFGKKLLHKFFSRVN